MRTIATYAKQSTGRCDIATELSFIRTEQARIETERKITADLVQHIEDDLAYEAWKKANGLTERLNRAGFEVMFDPHGLTR